VNLKHEASQLATAQARIADLEHCVAGQGERLHDYGRKYAALVAERDTWKQKYEEGAWVVLASAVLNERDSLRAQLATLTAERDQARAEGRRETWEAAAQVVEGHTNPYDAHDCAEQDCRPWIAQALRAQAKEGA
jgi:hypothetical protein